MNTYMKGPSPEARQLSEAMRAVNRWITYVTELYKYKRSNELFEPDPETIKSELLAIASISSDPPIIQRYAQIFFDWFGIASRIHEGDFEVSDIDNLLALAEQGDAERPIGGASLIGISTARILIKLERYEEAKATIVRLLMSEACENPLSARTVIEALANSLLKPNILTALNKDILVRAITLTGLIEIESERTRVMTTLNQQLDKL